MNIPIIAIKKILNKLNCNLRRIFCVKKKIIDNKTIIETLMCFKRAGANAIVTYFADKIANNLK